jgi:hypothetical protein
MSRDQTTASTDRREWMRSLLRNGALGLIASAALLLVGRRATNPCREPASGCRACQLFPRCELPLAQRMRSVRVRKERS